MSKASCKTQWENREMYYRTECFNFITKTVLLLLTGGCTYEYRPATYRTCDPPCAVEHSYCHDINVCSCNPGYRYVHVCRTGNRSTHQ